MAPKYLGGTEWGPDVGNNPSNAGTMSEEPVSASLATRACAWWEALIVSGSWVQRLRRMVFEGMGMDDGC